LAVVAVGVSVYTWRKYSDDQTSAHDALSQLAAAQPGYAQANRDFFAKPTCDVPATPVIPTEATGAYTDVCKSGESYATATTWLSVGARWWCCCRGCSGRTAGSRR